MMKTLFASAAALALALTCAAPAHAQDKVTVGIVTALSGPLAAPGTFQMNGFRLAEEEINREGFTVGGKKYTVQLKVYDTRCNAAEGSSAMQRLATVDKVPVVLGELCSPVASAEGPIAQDYSVPLIITVASAPDLTEQGNKYLFRVNAHNEQLNVALADFVGKQGWSPLAFIAWNNDAGRGGVNGMKKLLPPSIKTGYLGYFNVGEVDFSAHVSNLRAQNPRAVMLLMDEEPGSLAIKQIRDAGLKTQLVGTLAMGSDRFLKRLDAQRLEGMVQYNAFPPNANVPSIQAFSELYRKKYGEEAHGFAAQSYDGLKLAVAAMQKAGTVTDGKKLRDALAGIDYNGVIGHIKFDSKGQAQPPVYVTQWCADGKRRILYPEKLKADCGAG
ncbi:MAG TPA: ABC transporter substrate-binding protein [Burkholderiales bacterium]|nr:ABC transporter substrate-binding protein [Burkholderiales bacterium]